MCILVIPGNLPHCLGVSLCSYTSFVSRNKSQSVGHHFSGNHRDSLLAFLVLIVGCVSVGVKDHHIPLDECTSGIPLQECKDKGRRWSFCGNLLKTIKHYNTCFFGGGVPLDYIFFFLYLSNFSFLYLFPTCGRFATLHIKEKGTMWQC